MKVQIGKYYRRAWFEERSSDGTYRALHPPMGADALRLQQSYLAKPRSLRDALKNLLR